MHPSTRHGKSSSFFFGFIASAFLFALLAASLALLTLLFLGFFGPGVEECGGKPDVLGPTSDAE